LSRFVLVHGAYHGAWCWDQLRPELEGRGHRVATADLPCEDPNAGADAYASAVLDAAGYSDEPAIVVAHSLGGLTAPLVAERMPARLVVFLCALLPAVGQSFDDQHAGMETGFVPSALTTGVADGSASWPEQGAVEMFFHDCPPALAHDSARRLRRQHWLVTAETTPLRAWPDVHSAYVVTTEDRVIAPAYQRRLARDRLGVEPVEIASGHSPFLSHPAELAALLDALAA
jgi:pimeloyl-ACP methyl ester carboxylesterase